MARKRAAANLTNRCRPVSYGLDKRWVTDRESSTLRPTARKFLERSSDSLALSTAKMTRYVRLRYVHLVSALPLPLARKSPDSGGHQPRRMLPMRFHRVV